MVSYCICKARPLSQLILSKHKHRKAIQNPLRRSCPFVDTGTCHFLTSMPQNVKSFGEWKKAKAQLPLPSLANTLPRVFCQTLPYCRAGSLLVADAAALKRITPELSVK